MNMSYPGNEFISVCRQEENLTRVKYVDIDGVTSS